MGENFYRKINFEKFILRARYKSLIRFLHEKY